MLYPSTPAVPIALAPAPWCALEAGAQQEATTGRQQVEQAKRECGVNHEHVLDHRALVVTFVVQGKL